MGMPDFLIKLAELLGIPPEAIMPIVAGTIIVGYGYKLFRDNQAYSKDKLGLLLTLEKEHKHLIGSNLTIYHDAIAELSFALVTRIKHVRTTDQRDSWLKLHAACPTKNTFNRLASASELIGAKGADPIEKMPWLLHFAALVMSALCLCLVLTIVWLVYNIALSVQTLRDADVVARYAMLATVYTVALMLGWLGIVGPYISALLTHRDYKAVEKAKGRSEPAPH